MGEKKNCPNCGAPIEHVYNHQCPYCKTIHNFNVEEKEEINPRYLRNVKLVDVYHDHCSYSMILRFRGEYMPFSEVLEYSKGNTNMVIKAECTRPKDVNLSIRIDMADFMELSQRGNLERFLKYLPYEVDERSFVEALMKSGVFRC